MIRADGSAVVQEDPTDISTNKHKQLYEAANGMGDGYDDDMDQEDYYPDQETQDQAPPQQAKYYQQPTTAQNPIAAGPPQRRATVQGDLQQYQQPQGMKGPQPGQQPVRPNPGIQFGAQPHTYAQQPQQPNAAPKVNPLRATISYNRPANDEWDFDEPTSQPVQNTRSSIQPGQRPPAVSGMMNPMNLNTKAQPAGIPAASPQIRSQPKPAQPNGYQNGFSDHSTQQYQPGPPQQPNPALGRAMSRPNMLAQPAPAPAAPQQGVSRMSMGATPLARAMSKPAYPTYQPPPPVQLSPEEEYDQLSNQHEEIVDFLLKEENEIFSDHRILISTLIESIKKDSALYQSMQDQGRPVVT